MQRFPAVPLTKNHQHIHVRFRVEIATRFRAEKHHAQQIIAVPLAKPFEEGRQTGALIRPQIRLAFAPYVCLLDLLDR